MLLTTCYFLDDPRSIVPYVGIKTSLLGKSMIWKMTGWWFGTWLLFFHLLGMSSSQLTFIFVRGVETTNQKMWDSPPGGKVSKESYWSPPSVHHWNPLKSRIALNCLENFGIIKHGWKIWGNWQRSHPHFSFWNPRPGPKIPTSSRWWWAVAVSQFAVSWGDPGKMGVWENLKIARKHGGIFFSDGNMSVSFSYPKKVSESVSYFIYGDNHYQ